MLGNLKQLNQMRRQAMELKKELSQEKVELKDSGIHVVVAADQTIVSLTVNAEAQPQIVKLINQALQKSQKIAAQKMMQMGGGLSGLLGQS